eukprot:1005633-Amphidinium_carterae.1
MDLDATGPESRVKLGASNDGIERFFWTPALFGESINNADDASFFEDLPNLVAEAAGNVSSVVKWGQSAFEAAGTAPEAASTLMETITGFSG